MYYAQKWCDSLLFPNLLKYTIAVYKWLQRARKNKKATLRNVGEIIGRHHSIIGNVETKVRRMDVAEFIVYCEEIGLDPHDDIEYIQRQ
jgi:hypothetical protein